MAAAPARDDIEAILARDRSQLLLAERDGELIACAHVAVEDGAGYFGMFSVRPAPAGRRHRQDRARRSRTHRARRLALPAMRMTVIDVREELIAFYERRGYRRTGIKKPFPYGDARFGLPKRDDLRFEVLEKPLPGARLMSWLGARLCHRGTAAGRIPGRLRRRHRDRGVQLSTASFYAIEDVCTHDGGELAGGPIDG